MHSVLTEKTEDEEVDKRKEEETKKQNHTKTEWVLYTHRRKLCRYILGRH